MEAWPYKQECRGHDLAKKKLLQLMWLALLARCALTNCKWQYAVHRTWEGHEETGDRTQAVAGINSRIEIDGILGLWGTQRRSQGNPGGDKRAKEAKTKDAHKKNKLASIIAHQSFLSSNQIFNIFIRCREPITLFLDFQASTHHDVLNVDLLLLHQPNTKSLNADSLLFPNASAAPKKKVIV